MKESIFSRRTDESEIYVEINLGLESRKSVPILFLRVRWNDFGFKSLTYPDGMSIKFSAINHRYILDHRGNMNFSAVGIII